MVLAHLRLVRFLRAHKLSQAELARRLGRLGPDIHRSHVGHWLKGRRVPTLAQAVALERLTRSWDEGAIRPSEWVEIERPLEHAAA